MKLFRSDDNFDVTVKGGDGNDKWSRRTAISFKDVVLEHGDIIKVDRRRGSKSSTFIFKTEPGVDSRGRKTNFDLQKDINECGLRLEPEPG